MGVAGGCGFPGSDNDSAIDHYELRTIRRLRASPNSGKVYSGMPTSCRPSMYGSSPSGARVGSVSRR